MYKDVLQKLNNDRKVDENFIKRLEKNGFNIEYGKYNYWDSQEYVQIGKERVWLVDTYLAEHGSGCYVGYRYRNDVAEDIKDAIKEQKKILEKEQQLVNEVLPVE